MPLRFVLIGEAYTVDEEDDPNEGIELATSGNDGARAARGNPG
jgi:hypothetical protein